MGTVQIWAALVLPPVTSKSEVDLVQEKFLLKSQWFSKIVTIYHQLKKVNLEIFLFSLFSSQVLRKLNFFLSLQLSINKFKGRSWDKQLNTAHQQGVNSDSAFWSPRSAFHYQTVNLKIAFLYLNSYFQKHIEFTGFTSIFWSTGGSSTAAHTCSWKKPFYSLKWQTCGLICW